MSTDASDDSGDDCSEVTSTARFTPSIQRLSAANCEVFETVPEDGDETVNSEGLVPYSQTSQEENNNENNNCLTIAPCFKPPSTDVDIEKLSSKTFAPATEKKILWATKLYMEWRESRVSVDGEKGDIFKANLNAVDVNPECLCRALCCFLNEVHCVDGE